METLIGFVAGYLVGCKDGQDGVKRLRATAEAILSSDEVKRLTVEAMSFAQGTVRRAAAGRRLTGLSGSVGPVTDMLLHRASALGKRSKAA
jgi:hypothetical protein